MIYVDPAIFKKVNGKKSYAHLVADSLIGFLEAAPRTCEGNEMKTLLLLAVIKVPTTHVGSRSTLSAVTTGNPFQFLKWVGAF